MEQAFQTARLPLYGLAPSTPCRRFLASWGRSGEITHSLALGHLPSDGSLERQLRVEVKRADESLPVLKAELARGLWQRANLPLVPRNDLHALREVMDQAERDFETKSQLRWEPVALTIDGESVTAEKAQVETHWVAILKHDHTLLVITGETWPDDGLELVTIKDVDPYIAGSRLHRGKGHEAP